MIHPFWLPLVLRDPSGAGRSWEQRRGQTPPPPPCSVDCMHASGGFLLHANTVRGCNCSSNRRRKMTGSMCNLQDAQQRSYFYDLKLSGGMNDLCCVQQLSNWPVSSG